MAGGCQGCDKIKEAGYGFCDRCDKGTIFGVKLKSKDLYTVLAGFEEGADALAKSSCDGCQKAAKTNGFCKSCGIGIADKHLYMSKFAHAIARGKSIHTAPTSEYIKACSGCTKNADDHGFCKGCDRGIVAERAHDSKSFYDSALVAYDVIKKAVKTSAKCEKCAVAMVSDGKCGECKVSFKDGEPIKG